MRRKALNSLNERRAAAIAAIPAAVSDVVKACEDAKATLGAVPKKGDGTVISEAATAAASRLPRPLFVLYLTLKAYEEATEGVYGVSLLFGRRPAGSSFTLGLQTAPWLCRWPAMSTRWSGMTTAWPILCAPSTPCCRPLSPPAN